MLLVRKQKTSLFIRLCASSHAPGARYSVSTGLFSIPPVTLCWINPAMLHILPLNRAQENMIVTIVFLSGHFLCSQERRPSGCSGTQWRMRLRRPRRRLRAWLQLLLSHRNHSSTSDMLVRAELHRWRVLHTMPFWSSRLAWSGISLLWFLHWDFSVFLSLFSAIYLVSQFSLTSGPWVYVWNILPLWNLSDCGQQHSLL